MVEDQFHFYFLFDGASQEYTERFLDLKTRLKSCLYISHFFLHLVKKKKCGIIFSCALKWVGGPPWFRLCLSPIASRKSGYRQWRNGWILTRNAK